MSDHLPECAAVNHPKPYPNETVVIEWHERDCICPALRACEQRSYTLGIEVGKHDGWMAGHADGWMAARDAVAAQDHRWSVDYSDAIRDALAAIDALRGES